MRFQRGEYCGQYTIEVGQYVGIPKSQNLIAVGSEKSIAPDRIVAYQYNEDGSLKRTRPLCPYPRDARYLGQGDINDARSVWHNDRGFPIEDQWAAGDPAHFPLAFDNSQVHIYTVDVREGPQ